MAPLQHLEAYCTQHHAAIYFLYMYHLSVINVSSQALLAVDPI